LIETSKKERVVDLEVLRQRERASDLELNERQYGMLVKKGVDYLNPALSQRYRERTFFNG